MMMLDWADQDGQAASIIADPAQSPVVASRASISPLAVIGSLRVADFLILASSSIATFSAASPAALVSSIGLHILACVASVAGGLAVLRSSRAYTLRGIRSPSYAAGRALVGVCGAALCYYSVIAIGNGQMPVDASALAFLWMALGLVFLSRAVLAFCVHTLSTSGRLSWRAAVLADPAQAEALAAAIEHQSHGFTRVIKTYGLALVQTSIGTGSAACPEGVVSLFRDSRHDRFDAVIIAADAGSENLVDAAVGRLGGMVADIYVAHPPSKSKFVPVFGGDTAVISHRIAKCVARRPISGPRAVEKQTFDIILASLLLIALSPVFAVIAVCIKWESRGPVFFRQPRVGYDNRRFVVFKFRTMYHHMADINADRQAFRGDPRITKIGRFLRRFSFDELPQLLNVIAGDMSLVGPRPHAPNTKAAGMLFADAVPNYASRHRVRPGITGWAQVNGWRGETTGLEHLRKRVEHDLFYIDNWSIAFDIRILLLTLRREIYSKHAF